VVIDDMFPPYIVSGFPKFDFLPLRHLERFRSDTKLH